MLKRTALALLVTLSATAVAEDPKAKAARDELERQLSQMVGKQPTKVRVDFVSLDDPNYRLEDATFELDGRPLGAPSLGKLSGEGTHLVWNGDVTPGKHLVRVRLVFANGASIVISDEGGYKWKVGGDVSFEVASGIEVRVQVTPTRDPRERDVARRFKLSLPAQPVMIAQLDDGKMPDAPTRPVPAAVDAGPSPAQLAADEQKKVEEARRLAAEAKQQKDAEALEAKRLAAEAKTQKAADDAEARRLAAAEKQQQAADAIEAKRLAAEEKKRAALDAADEKKRLAQAAVDAKSAPPVIDAGAPAALALAEPLDAGAAPTVVLEVPDAGLAAPVAAAPAPEAEEGPPWMLIGGAGALAALVFLVVVARRRARPPTLDD